MIDIGGSGLAALRKAGRAPRELAGIAITHLHGDHVGGLPFLLLDALYNEPRTASLPLLGPKLLQERIDALYHATYRELAPMRLSFDLPVTEIAPGESAPLAGFEIQGFLADHMDPPNYPLSLRVRAPSGKVATFSGDTAMNPRLLEAAENADLLVAECSALKPPVGRHCSWLDWKAVLPKLTARRLVLSHLNHRVRDAIPRLLSEAPANVNLTFADDGMIFDI